MSRVISHPVLAHSKPLEVFLSATEEQFVAHKASSPSPKTTEEAPATTQTGAAAASAFFSSVLNTVSHMATNLTTEVLVYFLCQFGTHNNKEVDATFIEKEDYLNLLREKLEQVLNTTELHIQRSTDCVEQTVCYRS